MYDPRRASLEALLKALLVESGALPAEIRKNLVDGKVMAGSLGALAIRVQENATRISTEQFQALSTAGIPDDQIFECVVAAAVGAGMERLRRVRELLAESVSSA